MSEWFVRPDALPALALVPVVALLLWRLERARGRGTAALVGARAAVLADVRTGRRRVRRVAWTAALAFAGVAALQPAWGEGSGDGAQRGVDVVVCLDVSRSMLAGDVAPTRLARAQREVRALAERARGDRLALVVFAGEARLAVPLTQDAETFAAVAGIADPWTVARGGTDLAAALGAADEALRGTTGAHETVVLLTDGEDLAGRGLRAAARLRERGIVVHAVGLGTARGAKVAVPADAAPGLRTAGEMFLRDASGAEVVTAMDAASLRSIADATGGEFVEGGDDGDTLVALYERRIAPLARKAFVETVRGGTNERGNRFQWALLPAFVLWLADLALSERRRR